MGLINITFLIQTIVKDLINVTSLIHMIVKDLTKVISHPNDLNGFIL